MNKEKILAKYFSNVFHIELSEKVKLFGNEIDPKVTNETYAIFVHEYWHYLLNISTSVRIRDFSLWYQLFPIFSRTLTVDNNGESDTTTLTEEDKKLLEEIGDLYITYSECGFSISEDEEMIDFKVISDIISEDTDLTLKGIKVPFKNGKIKVEITTNTKKYEDYLYINNDFIDESIANSIERMIDNVGKKNPITPYYTLSKISEYFNNGASLSYYELACIGTLSLLTTNPALSLNGLFKDYIILKKNNTINDSVTILCNTIKPLFEEICTTIMSDMEEILRIYENRHPAYQAINFIKEKIEKAIYFRSRNLLFELTPFKNNIVNHQALSKIIFEIFKPCDVIQKTNGDFLEIERDIIKSFELEQIEIDNQLIYPSFLMQVINCQLNYFKAHWAIHNLMDSRLAEEKCPYFSTCGLKCRTETPDICLKAPWKTFIKNGEKCAYSHAVSTLIGLTKLKQE